jgi:hypothetical protein
MMTNRLRTEGRDHLLAAGRAGLLAGLLIEARPTTHGSARQDKVSDAAPQPAQAG